MGVKVTWRDDTHTRNKIGMAAQAVYFMKSSVWTKNKTPNLQPKSNKTSIP